MRIPARFIMCLVGCTALTACAGTPSDVTPVNTRPNGTSMTISDSIAVCKEVQRDRDIPFSCDVTYLEGHVTMVTQFANERSMNAYFEVFYDYVAGPFCEAATSVNRKAYLLVTLRRPEVGSIYSCETGESSEWVSLDSLNRS